MIELPVGQDKHAPRPKLGPRKSADYQASVQHWAEFCGAPVSPDALNYMKSKLPDAPSGLIVKSIWCHTLSTPGGLMVTDMQLIAPVDDVDD